MLKIVVVVFLLCLDLTGKSCSLIKANECAINTECKNISECPRILENFHLFKNKPFCNLHLKGAFVCCLKPLEQYTMEKDEEIKAVRECKSYQSLRSSCTKELIVGGVQTEPKEFPFMALLIYKTENEFKPICGGTLISNKFVLTAAHCLLITKSPNIARLGELDWSSTRDIANPVDYEIKEKFIHPQYQKLGIKSKYNDIALAELAKEVTYNEFIMPACLPLVDGRDFKEFISAGWGYRSDNHKQMSTHMYKVKLESFDDNTCVEKIVQQPHVLINGVNKRTQMCAGSSKDNNDTCHGDSGGPLFVDHPDYSCLFLVVGITSFAQGGCGNIGQPAIYTRVQLYLDWIEQVVWNEPAKLN